ncbi:MAG: cIT [Chlamydiales bacterium]|jgi:citrate synthase|nr:cIT [Chlamydiales bacterium]
MLWCEIFFIGVKNMDPTVLPTFSYTITKKQLDTGLRGVPVGYCATSSVDPVKGLFYAGVPIEQLAIWKPQEVIYLLKTGKRGTVKEIEQLWMQIKEKGNCRSELLHSIQKQSTHLAPMLALSYALLECNIWESSEGYAEDGLNIIAKIPQIVATIINSHAGWGETPASNPSLGYIENFVSMLNVPNVDKQKLAQVMELFNILHYDHGGGNLSTFVAKAVASGLQNMYNSLLTAMLALDGPLHGNANQGALSFIQKVISQCKNELTAEKVQSVVREHLMHDKVPGFGHAVLRIEDPRAQVFYKAAQELYPENNLIKAALLLREEAPKVLQEITKTNNPYPNVDAISGALLSAAGFSYPEYFTLLFGMSRIVGIALQITYERCEAREGKGTPIVRPKYIYKPRS